MFNYKFTNKLPKDVCRMCGVKISKSWSDGGIGAVCRVCRPERDITDLVKLGIIRNIEPEGVSFRFEALIDDVWYKCGPACGDWSYVKNNKNNIFSVPVGYWELKELYNKHEDCKEDTSEIITVNGRNYKKVAPDEHIRDGALQSFNGSDPCPITNALGETIGFTPTEFSELRVFYNPYKKPGTCNWCGVDTINAIDECDTCHELRHRISGNPEMAKRMLEEMY